MRSLAIVSPVSYETPKALMAPEASMAAADAGALSLAPPLAPPLAGAVLSLAGEALPAPPGDDGAPDDPLLPPLHAATISDSAMIGAPPERRMRIDVLPGRAEWSDRS